MTTSVLRHKTNKTLKKKHNTTGRAADDGGTKTNACKTYRCAIITSSLKSIVSWIIIKYNCNLTTSDIPSLPTW